MISDLVEIRKKGFNALTKELGASGMAIFLRQLENGNGDYTAEREEWLKDITIEDVVESINKRKNQTV